MKKNIYRYAALAGLIAAAMLPAGSMIAPAAAQIGGIVHDPRNYNRIISFETQTRSTDTGEFSGNFARLLGQGRASGGQRQETYGTKDST